MCMCVHVHLKLNTNFSLKVDVLTSWIYLTSMLSEGALVTACMLVAYM